ncbi:general substrate transporter [Nemania diffusa]|nr:general substrate transporter [Nemania diffusa]
MPLKRVFRILTRPKKWFIATLYISSGSFLNGFDTGSIGSITLMPAFEHSVATLSPLLRGLTVSVLLLTAAVSSLFAGLVAERFGHLHIVTLGGIVFTIGAAIETGAFCLPALLVGRGLVGIGEGLYIPNLNVYVSEIAPRKKRGMMVAIPVSLFSIGTAAGYFTCYGSARIVGDWQWRLPFLIQTLVGAVFSGAHWVLPQSPRWLIARSQRQAARNSMKRLDFEEAEIATNLDTTTTNEEGEGETLPPNDELTLTWRGISGLFSKRYRFRTFLALFILGMAQLCGIDGVLYYAPTLFAQAGLHADTASFVASGLSAILMSVISVPAFLFADRWGRRSIFLTGGSVIAAAMLVIGSLYATGSVRAGSVGGWLVIVGIYIFALAYVSTWAIVAKIYATEIHPAHIRATANALAQALNWLANFLVAFITPIFLARSSSGPYFLFAGFTILTLIVLVLCMPETRGRSLESIEAEFIPPFEKLICRKRPSVR